MRSSILLSGLLLCTTVSSSCHGNGDDADKYVDHQHVRRGQFGVLKHRHFFNFDLNQLHDTANALQFRDYDDLFATSTKHPPLANFTVLAQIDREDSYSEASQGFDQQQQILTFNRDLKLSPNTSDKETVVNLAKMTSDAYLFDPREPAWLNTSLGFNFTSRFGWKGDGLRGHVFTTEDDSFVVVSFKGTTIDPRDKLSGRDRLNDNKLFGCCCGAQNPYHYSPVCNCSTGYYQCDSNCLTSTVLQNDTYYSAALFIMGKVQERYPKSAFWAVGHSLGGSLASLVGLTFDIPSVSFEAPPERLPARRIGLLPRNSTTPPSDRAMAYHFGNTADPVFMGACNGFFSSCSFAGFSFESQCHSGRRCSYDTVKDKGWRVSIANHRINYVIENVLKVYDEVPLCEEDVECVDCFNWKFS